MASRSNCILALSSFLLFALLGSTALPIYPPDKAILMNWISTWKNASAVLDINAQGTECDFIINRSSRERAMYCVDVAALNYSRPIAINLGNTNADPNNDAASTTIPRSIGQLTEVVELSIRALGLIGTVPEELFLLPNLQKLLIESNRLYGTLPAAIRNCTNLQSLDMASNMFSGPIPDLSPLSNLAFLKLSDNNFGCPQPWLRPSVLTSTVFPQLEQANCSFDNNLFARLEDGYNTVCGEQISQFVGQSVCSFRTQPVPDVRRAPVPQQRIFNPQSGQLLVEINGTRHSFLIVDPPTGRQSKEYVTFDVYSVSTHPSGRQRSIDGAQTVYKFKGYKSFDPFPGNDLKYRFVGELEGTNAQFDTIWDFSVGENQVKFSFEVSGLPFAPTHASFTINLQIGLKVPSITRNTDVSAIKCKILAASSLNDLTRPDAAFSCDGLSARLFMGLSLRTLSDISLVLNVSTPSGNLAVDFPIYYERDNLTKTLIVTNSRFQIMPFGVVDTLNFLSTPDHPVSLTLNQSRLQDPDGDNQFVVASLGLEMERFNNYLFYDPTITISSLFQPIPEPVNAAGVTPQVAEQNATIPLAIGISVGIVAVIALGVVTAAVVSPKFRYTIAPFTRPKTGTLVPIEDDSDGIRDARRDSKWIAGKPRDTEIST